MKNIHIGNKIENFQGSSKNKYANSRSNTFHYGKNTKNDNRKMIIGKFFVQKNLFPALLE